MQTWITRRMFRSLWSKIETEDKNDCVEIWILKFDSQKNCIWKHYNHDTGITIIFNFEIVNRFGSSICWHVFSRVFTNRLKCYSVRKRIRNLWVLVPFREVAFASSVCTSSYKNMRNRKPTFSETIPRSNSI